MDFDDLLELILRGTLVFWLFPYVFWYFARVLARTAWGWVTEPEKPVFS